MLKSFPGFGYRSAERLAIHLAFEKPDQAKRLVEIVSKVLGSVRSCVSCGNMAEEEFCEICRDETRDSSILCIVETISDLISIERAGVYRGLYTILGGRLSPLQGIHPEDLRFDLLEGQLGKGQVNEIILALGNDIESEATCHFIQDNFLADHNISLSRIAFGLPSGGGINIADTQTLQSALNGRRQF